MNKEYINRFGMLITFSIFYNLILWSCVYAYGGIFIALATFSLSCSLVTMLLCAYAKMKVNDKLFGPHKPFYNAFMFAFTIPTTIIDGFLLITVGPIGAAAMCFVTKSVLKSIEEKDEHRVD